MKTYLLLFLITICSLHIHCKNGTRSTETTNVSFTVEETDDEYRIFAAYDPEKTKAVESVLDQYLKQAEDPSFTNTQIDADLTLSNKTTFHIKHTTGDLELEMDKGRNSPETLSTFKEMAVQLKEAL